jgi:threonine dehydrogenase-like Zn-dependent dehydrogenase
MHCYTCTILGDQAKCEQRLGYGGWVPAWEHPYLVGGLAEYAWLLPDSDIVVLPSDMRPEAVVLGDALRIMVHGLDRIGGLDYGDTVLVQGSGAVGLMGLLLAKDAGADKVIIIGAPAGRLNLAHEFGAFATLDVTQTSVAERAGPVPINPHIINKKQITLTGAWSAANKHFLRALKLLKKLPDEEVDKLVTHRFTLAQTNDALIAAERQETLKAVITPGVGL